MKRVTALMLFMMLLFTMSASSAYSSNRYDPDDWRYIEEDEIANPNLSYPDKYYGANCKEFVRHVCSSEDRGYLPATDYDNDDRTLVGLTSIEGGQWLNNVHDYYERLDRGPTPAEVKAAFRNARSGDVVQMHWGGATWHNEHTALINDIDDNGVVFFQSHVEKDSSKICGFKVSSNYYDWQTLSDRYSFSDTDGGFTIYHFRDIEINEKNFPDETFRNFVSRYDTNRDGVLSYYEELENVTRLYLYDTLYTSLKGIEFFEALTELSCNHINITALDLTKNKALTKLECRYCYKLTELNVSDCKALTRLDCGDGVLAALNVSGCTALTYLRCSRNNLREFDVSSCTALTELDCSENVWGIDPDTGNFYSMSKLNVSGCKTLTTLNCRHSQLTTLDVSKNTALTYLDCFSNCLTELNISNNKALTILVCGYNQLTELNVKNNPALTAINCLTTLDVSGHTALTDLLCDYNQLTALNVSGCTALMRLSCGNNLGNFPDHSTNQLTTLDVSTCTALTELECNYLKLTELDSAIIQP